MSDNLLKLTFIKDKYLSNLSNHIHSLYASFPDLKEINFQNDNQIIFFFYINEFNIGLIANKDSLVFVLWNIANFNNDENIQEINQSIQKYIDKRISNINILAMIITIFEYYQKLIVYYPNVYYHFRIIFESVNEKVEKKLINLAVAEDILENKKQFESNFEKYFKINSNNFLKFFDPSYYSNLITTNSTSTFALIPFKSFQLSYPFKFARYYNANYTHNKITAFYQLEHIGNKLMSLVYRDNKITGLGKAFDNEMIKLIAKNPKYEEEIILYRGVGDKLAEIILMKKIGDVLKLEGFQSQTFNLKWTFNFTGQDSLVLYLKYRAGSKFLCLTGQLSEVLTYPNKKYKVEAFYFNNLSLVCQMVEVEEKNLEENLDEEFLNDNSDERILNNNLKLNNKYNNKNNLLLTPNKLTSSLSLPDFDTKFLMIIIKLNEKDLYLYYMGFYLFLLNNLNIFDLIYYNLFQEEKTKQKYYDILNSYAFYYDDYDESYLDYIEKMLINLFKDYYRNYEDIEKNKFQLEPDKEISFVFEMIEIESYRESQDMKNLFKEEKEKKIKLNIDEDILNKNLQEEIIYSLEFFKKSTNRRN